MRIFIRYWMPALLWMGCIFYFSTDAFSSNHTAGLIEPAIKLISPNISDRTLGTLHFLIRKLAHVTEYAALSFLVFRALRQEAPVRWTVRWAAGTLAIVAGYALLDEGHQWFVPSRQASLYDSALDTFGGLLMQIYLAAYHRGMSRKPLVR